MQGIQRYVVLAYFIAGALAWITLSKFLSALFYAVDIPDASILSTFTVTSAIGLCIAAFLVIFAYRDERVSGFSNEVVGELKKVSWPGKKETQTATVVVLWTAAALAVLMFVFDSVWGRLTGIIYK